MKRIKEMMGWVFTVLVFVLFFGGVLWGCTIRYRECRRVHPWWYCLDGR